MSAPFSHYRQMQIETATPGQRIVMLLDGALRFVATAKEAEQRQDATARSLHVVRAQNILVNLMGTLKAEDLGELGSSLLTLYGLCFDTLREGEATGDMTLLDKASALLWELREMWAEADAASRVPTSGKTIPPPPPRSALSAVG